MRKTNLSQERGGGWQWSWCISNEFGLTPSHPAREVPFHLEWDDLTFEDRPLDHAPHGAGLRWCERNGRLNDYGCLPPLLWFHLQNNTVQFDCESPSPPQHEAVLRHIRMLTETSPGRRYVLAVMFETADHITIMSSLHHEWLKMTIFDNSSTQLPKTHSEATLRCRYQF